MEVLSGSVSSSDSLGVDQFDDAFSGIIALSDGGDWTDPFEVIYVYSSQLESRCLMSESHLERYVHDLIYFILTELYLLIAEAITTHEYL